LAVPADGFLVTCVCTDEALHRRRIEGRRRDIPGWHEIGWDRLLFMRAEQPPLTAAQLTVDALDSLEKNMDLVRAYVGASAEALDRSALD